MSVSNKFVATALACWKEKAWLDTWAEVTAPSSSSIQSAAKRSESINSAASAKSWIYLIVTYGITWRSRKP